VTPEEILVTTGGSEAILFAIKSCFDPGDELIVPEPFYANYNGFAIDAGVTLIPITTHIDDDFALPGIEKFESLISSKTKGILMNAPANPTG
ncbi:MAG: aminotransferase class I/II-fold pyridoxal phosphate-dependent enzyme, partial [Flavobacteriales bacterium]